MTRRTLVTTDAVELSARHRQGPSPSATVVLVHGFTATGDHRRVVAVADALHARGVDVITYDSRGHGRSSGASTLGDLELHDVAAAVAAAREHTDRVVIVGASMGAIAALRYAATDDRLVGTVLVSCPAAWRLPRNLQGALAAGLTRTRFGRAAASRLLRVRVAAEWHDPDPPVELAGRVRAPLAVLHGDADAFIPVSDAHELHARIGAPTRLRVIPGMGHAFQPAAVPEILDAVEWMLGPAVSWS